METPGRALDLPGTVQAVLERFLTADFTTFARDGTPITWPVLPTWEPVDGRFAVMTSIGLPHKAFNARRDPRVSLFYSDSTGSDLRDPPTVLVQGDATVSAEIIVSASQLAPDLAAALERTTVALLRRQPNVGLYVSNPLSRALMGWYFLRLLIVVHPRRIAWGWDYREGWEVRDVA
ncbi:MAG: pyridoxamine 5'-phosphate oxidase family protein [Egibacteraceae bacterium]